MRERGVSTYAFSVYTYHYTLSKISRPYKLLSCAVVRLLCVLLNNTGVHYVHVHTVLISGLNYLFVTIHC